MRKLMCLVAGLVVALAARQASAGTVRFVVVDPVTGKPLSDGIVTLEDLNGLRPSMTPKGAFDFETWRPASKADRVVVLPLGKTLYLKDEVQEGQPQIPTKEIYVKVTATRIRVQATNTSTGEVRTKEQISRFTNVAAGNTNTLVQNQSGVASDSAGQAHIRGEHSEITYVVDGVPLPDTLSGRQGSIVIPSTVESLDMMTGAYAPEFGIQTAAILNITTSVGSKRPSQDVSVNGGSFGAFGGDLTASGPMGSRGSYTIDLNASKTNNYLEPQQPSPQATHNVGSYYSLFSKMRLNSGRRDVFDLTLSRNPDAYENSNRAGLPGSYADVGQGYGFLGLRNADGTRPDATGDALGSQRLVLPSQQAAGMDIDTKEMNEFATLSWRHQFDSRNSGLLALTALHAGQDVTNSNPAVSQTNLPVDSSIEYNPDVSRNIHHLQLSGSVSSDQGLHHLKAGFVFDRQSGHESYQIGSASQLALDELAALDPLLAPAGVLQVDKHGNPVLDVNGNQVYHATSNTVPVLNVERSGTYGGAYLQDTWKVSRRFAVNYGVRADWYSQTQSLGQESVSKFLLSPRLNFSYGIDRRTALRWSYNKLFNTPPTAQGSIVGAPIQPETLDQYEVSIDHELSPGQRFKAAYYVKQMRNQVDTGLLVPGSQIGLYSAVNFERGGVHGLELSYDIYARQGVGWDGYLNYSLSKAAPNGLDNTGAPVPDFNDHDQRQTIGAGLAYTWKNQASAAATFEYGSGLASSIVRGDRRTPRSELDLRYSSSPKLFHGNGGFSIDLENVFDSRTVINFESGFSGTRFMQGRRILLSLFAHF